MKHKLFAAVLILFSTASQAHFLDAISGHVRDIRSRFSDHQIIKGDVLKKGDIDISAKGQDMFHSSSGTWSLVRVGNELFLQSGEKFRSSPGPDYHVYISKDPAIKDNDQFSKAQIEVSRLIKPNGAAYYKLATDDLDSVHSILIWCKQFKEYIGSADLK